VLQRYLNQMRLLRLILSVFDIALLLDLSIVYRIRFDVVYFVFILQTTTIVAFWVTVAVGAYIPRSLQHESPSAYPGISFFSSSSKKV
jgi:hypothetical protein